MPTITTRLYIQRAHCPAEVPIFLLAQKKALKATDRRLFCYAAEAFSLCKGLGIRRTRSHELELAVKVKGFEISQLPLALVQHGPLARRLAAFEATHVRRIDALVELVLRNGLDVRRARLLSLLVLDERVPLQPGSLF